MCTWDATIDGKPAKMHLLDTTAQDPCETRPNDKMKWADGFLVVFSVTDRTSFESARALINHMQRLSAGRRPAAVLVGNKSDLRHFRVVTETEARDVAAVLGCPYMETSASEDYEGVAEAFTKLFAEARAAVKRDRIHSLLNRCPLSTISHIRDTLKSMTDSRARTNTF
ncbi:hypothetical protein NP493_321g03003 [Ridgeia piscesae]|uniref:small monomeric GTPase n=1 Tax=Ridgeia piscesae TaxID=27915 RepID=A0AAD9L4Y2_RIDPI|nr:hypothetical protein NP493_321g03003 [Ridgeia piscesae]